MLITPSFFKIFSREQEQIGYILIGIEGQVIDRVNHISTKIAKGIVKLIKVQFYAK